MPNYFYRVVKGCVQLHITPFDSDEKKIVALIRDGESICHEAALLGEAYPFSADSVCDTRIIACPRPFILDLIQEKPHVAVNMLHNLSKQNMALSRRMGDLLLKSASARIACYLLEQAPAIPSATYELTLPASKQSVASHLHLSQETLSRILTEMKKAGIIEMHGRVLSVNNREKLEKVRAGCSLKSFLAEEG